MIPWLLFLIGIADDTGFTFECSQRQTVDLLDGDADSQFLDARELIIIFIDFDIHAKK